MSKLRHPSSDTGADLLLAVSRRRRNAPEGWWRKFLLEEPAHANDSQWSSHPALRSSLRSGSSLDGDAIVFTTGHDAGRARAVPAGDPRVALCVDDERPPFLCT